MKMTTTVSAMSVLFLVLVTQHTSLGQGKDPTPTPKLLVTECAQDGFKAWIPYSAVREKIAQFDDVELDAGFRSHGEGPTFWFVRAKQDIFEGSVNDIYSGSVWVANDHQLRLPSGNNQARVAPTSARAAQSAGPLFAFF
jgi:hypothetical protein